MSGASFSKHKAPHRAFAFAAWLTATAVGRSPLFRKGTTPWLWAVGAF